MNTMYTSEELQELLRDSLFHIKKLEILNAELLAALKAAESVVSIWMQTAEAKYGPGWRGSEPSVLDQIRGTIAKAEGKE
jgi:hypothetical protein